MTDPALANLQIACPDCGRPMIPRTNRDTQQEFLGCSAAIQVFACADPGRAALRLKHLAGRATPARPLP